MGVKLAEPEASLNVDELWKKYYEGRKNRNGIFYRNLLIEHYRDLVKYTAERLYRKLPKKEELDDLISAGIFGLIDAISNYDSSRKVKFETYCALRIRGSMLDELRRMDWVPRHARLKSRQLEKAKSKLESESDYKPTEEQLIQELSKDVYLAYFSKTRSMEMKSEKKAEKIINGAKNIPEIISLYDYEECKDGTDIKYLQESKLLEDKKSENPFLKLQKEELKDLLTRGLTRAERLIIVLYYYEEKTMKEIGKALELSESRVSQLHKSILARLKTELYARKKDYLEETSYLR